MQPVLRPATTGEISIREQSTSPTSADRDSSITDSTTGISKVDVSTGITDIVRETTAVEDITIENQRLLEKGIDDRLQTIDRIEEQRIDIPQPIPGTDQIEPHR